MALPPRLATDIDDLVRDGWEILVTEDGNRFLLIVPKYVLPPAYTPTSVDLMVMADYMYPQSPMDMFWTDPHVSLATGAAPQNTSSESYGNRNWQRWSYHYQWDPARHTVCTHLAVVSDRLARGC